VAQELRTRDLSISRPARADLLISQHQNRSAVDGLIREFHW
jgi:hypothetical protein